MMSKTYKKLIATRLSDDFRSAIDIQELPIPTPNSGEILIRNKFAGINAGFDTLLCKGNVPYVNLTPPFDLGVEAVGEVVEIGEEVNTIQIGDAVATTVRGGGYREYQVISAHQAIKIREAIPEVLTLMPTGMSALVALEEVGEMKSRETVLVTAAAGGVGHIAVQLAKLAGNHVIGVCGSEVKAKLLESLGCDRIINYRNETLDTVLQQEYPNGINLAFDCVGKQTFDTCVEHLAVRGRLVVVGFISEYANDLESVTQPRIYQKLFWKSASVRGFLMPHFSEYAEEARDRLLDLFYTGKLKVAVDPREFHGIEAIPDAVEYLLSGQNCGKVVVKF
ncbi:alcohol dehydrogenase [Leptolyngbya boryana NIES-2135]|uniref:Alcohol dehydrogenase n=2 Tax=Leptolyngbya boryana TaxID=1184 RepID=A0A1Z4JGI8_LEPBY|nr:zinc-binding dehydrogenase [Leptolyngbya boryana]MBD2370324.1 zinc-binding dehydrogenase [Leptolyngbya sp. FACHB-161]MBD2376668.1 zinc-binding dehydrogenase [Leptolyngbya sp. FACHB-238]MBD2400938.1 zinc-binding dehydrogenase [Leptolyngbya sp. FACHB-239]MBD2407586.1 zinc-binding dehydrogenase [Leptolyngbya sp. FACHB-402]BAY55783.1 alcohol dehydrogenase [Leptolyngbya boryana NIES-2135]